MRPRYQRQLAGQVTFDDNLFVRGASDPFVAGQATTHPLVLEPTSPSTSAPSKSSTLPPGALPQVAVVLLWCCRAASRTDRRAPRAT